MAGDEIVRAGGGVVGTSPPLSWANAFTTWQLAPVSTAVFVLLAIGYLILARRAPGWPFRTTAAFLCGVLVALLAVDSAVGAYSTTLYWMHMIQHLTLIMIVPWLLILGRPLRLLADVAGREGEDGVSIAGSASERGAQRGRSRAKGQRTANVLGGKVVGAITAPVFTLGVYAIVLVGTHLTGYLAQARLHPALHGLEIALYVVGGYLFFVTIFGGEPIRWKLSYPLRLFLILVGMAADTIVGVILMMTVHDPLATSGMLMRDWGPSPRGDLNAGGAIMWVFGDGLMLAIAVSVIGRWVSEPKDTGMGDWLESVRRQQFSAMTGASADTASIDDDDASLAAYNAMLARLADPKAGDPRGE